MSMDGGPTVTGRGWDFMQAYRKDTEVHVTFDVKTEGAADGLDLNETDVAKFGESNPKVTESKGDCRGRRG